MSRDLRRQPCRDHRRPRLPWSPWSWLPWLSWLLLAALVACEAPAESQAPADPRVSAPLPTESSPESGAGGGTLRWGIAEPPGITPATATTPDGLLIVDALYDSLTRMGADGRLRGAAAWSWDAEPDAATWTFRLRSAARWHDGTPVTAQDFVEGWALAVRTDLVGFHLSDVVGYDDVRSGRSPTLAGVTAIDVRTLQVRLTRPRGDFAVVAGHPSLAPVHPAAGDDPGSAERPVGNGPFRMAEARARGQFVRLVPADGWRNGRAQPRLAEVLFRVMDPDAAYVAFQQGRVDVTRLPPGALEQAVRTYGEAPDGYTAPGVLRGDVPTLYHLAFDVTEPPFEDPQVRRAVSLAIDRTAVAAGVLQGNVRPARSAVPPAVPGSRLRACSACRHDPEAARAIFSALGITELTLWFDPQGGHGQVARMLRSQLADAGVAVRFESPDSDTFRAAVADGRAGWFRAGWAAEHLTLDDMLVALLHSDGAGNAGGYSDADVDRLLEQATAELDADRRIALFAEAEDLAVGRDQAIVPLFSYRLDLVAGERLEGFRLDPFGRVDLAAVGLGPVSQEG